MSFVKDDSSNSRGVGAIAAVDMGTSRRRAAAAREAHALARRDALMSRSTLGRINTATYGRGPVIGTRGMEVGWNDSPATPPRPPRGGGGGGGGRPVRPFSVVGSGTLVKSPGSQVIVGGGGRPGPKGGGIGGRGDVFASGGATKPPTRPFGGGSTDVKGGSSGGGSSGGGSSGGGGGGGGGGAELEPIEPVDLEPADPAPAKSSSGKLFAILAIGLGALMFLGDS